MAGRAGTPEIIDAMRDVHQSTHTPICCGENIYMRWGFRELFEMVTGIKVPVPDRKRHGHARRRCSAIRREVLYPPREVQPLVEEADITHIHDEWTKKKFDEGKYISTDICGRPHDRR